MKACSGTTPVSATIASVTAVPPTPCTWGSSTPTSCVANVSLAVNQSITFTVTLAPPIADGSYRNCFLADGKPTVPPDFPSAYTDVNPTTAPGGGMWGNCTPFIVTNAAARACPTGQELVPGRGCVARPVCTAPLVLNAAGTECIRPPVCVPPMIFRPGRRSVYLPAGNRAARPGMPEAGDLPSANGAGPDQPANASARREPCSAAANA